MKKGIFFIFLINLLSNIYAQNYPKIDSLEKLLTVINEVKTDENEKDEVLKQLYSEYRYTNSQKALNVTIEGLKWAEIQKNDFNIYFWYYEMGNVYREQRIYHLSLKAYAKAIKKLKKQNLNHANIGWLLIEVGNVYYALEDFKKAEDIYNEAISYFELNNDENGISVATSNLGLTFDKLKKHDKALLYYQKACELNISEEKYVGLALNYSNIGLNFSFKNRFDSANIYFKKSIFVIKKHDSTRFEIEIWNKIAFSYILQSFFDSAIVVLNNSISIANKNVSKKEKALLYQLLAKAYAEKKDFPNAIKSINESFKLDNYMVMNSFRIMPYREASLYYEQIGDMKTALEMLKTHVRLHEEIYNENVWETTYLFEKERNKTEKELLIKDLRISKGQEKFMKLQIFIALLFIFLMAVFIVLIIKRNKIKHRVNELLQEKNRIINERNYELTLKNKKISDQNIELNFKQEQIKRMLDKYEKNINDTHLLPSEKNEEKFLTDRNKYSLNNQIREVILLYDKKIQTKSIEMITDFKIEAIFHCNNEEMISVWSNIIENAINAIEYSGKITISLNQNEHDFIVKFRDNGCGIDNSEYNNIFKPFVTYSQNAENKGLGLYIAKKIINKHNGAIGVESEKGVFTEFTIILPK